MFAPGTQESETLPMDNSTKADPVVALNILRDKILELPSVSVRVNAEQALNTLAGCLAPNHVFTSGARVTSVTTESVEKALEREPEAKPARVVSSFIIGTAKSKESK